LIHKSSHRVILGIAAAGIAGISSLLFWKLNQSPMPRADDASYEALVNSYSQQFKSVREIHAKDLQRMKERGPVILVDVRSEEEMKVSTIPGAISLASYLSRPSPTEGIPVVFYCTIGYRSGKYIETQKRHQENTFNLRGGVVAWARENLPFDKNGQATQNIHVYGRQWNLVPPQYNPTW